MCLASRAQHNVLRYNIAMLYTSGVHSFPLVISILLYENITVCASIDQLVGICFKF